MIAKPEHHMIKWRCNDLQTKAQKNQNQVPQVWTYSKTKEIYQNHILLKVPKGVHAIISSYGKWKTRNKSNHIPKTVTKPNGIISCGVCDKEISRINMTDECGVMVDNFTQARITLSHHIKTQHTQETPEIEHDKTATHLKFDYTPNDTPHHTTLKPATQLRKPSNVQISSSLMV